jgi:hypothetical protein
MLIHVDALTSRFAPVRVYHFDEASGSVLIGDEKARILLDRDEVEELSRILQSLSLACSAVGLKGGREGKR